MAGRTRQSPITFVVVPEYVARHWWERILYNQSAKRLRTALLGRPHTVVVNVPYRREDAVFEGRGRDAVPHEPPDGLRPGAAGPCRLARSAAAGAPTDGI